MFKIIGISINITENPQVGPRPQMGVFMVQPIPTCLWSNGEQRGWSVVQEDGDHSSQPSMMHPLGKRLCVSVQNESRSFNQPVRNVPTIRLSSVDLGYDCALEAENESRSFP